MYCPNCGVEIRKLVNFCPNCRFCLEKILPLMSPAAIRDNKVYLNASNAEGQSHFKAYNVNTIRQTHKRAYEKWTDNEDTELTLGFHQGLTIPQLAEKHRRQEGGIKSRLQKLNLT
ncbi:MAG: zinc ribbon domain-containing protein [Candidatus Bathyarchaeota archaeon]|nr:zinc ribbon domain-containing protein [Candidatus Bathyarchaeota archaeon]